MSNKETIQEKRIKELEQKVARLRDVKNPIIDTANLKQNEQNKVDLQTTLDNAIDVLGYLMLNDHSDEGLGVAIVAREWITECTLNAIRFVNDNMETQEVEL